MKAFETTTTSNPPKTPIIHRTLPPLSPSSHCMVFSPALYPPTTAHHTTLSNQSSTQPAINSISYPSHPPAQLSTQPPTNPILYPSHPPTQITRRNRINISTNLTIHSTDLLLEVCRRGPVIRVQGPPGLRHLPVDQDTVQVLQVQEMPRCWHEPQRWVAECGFELFRVRIGEWVDGFCGILVLVWFSKRGFEVLRV